MIQNDYDLFRIDKSGYLGKQLGDICHISNGLATLCDEVYVHELNYLTNHVGTKVYSGNDTYKWIIYPYDTHGEIIQEEPFKNSNPQTYLYLKEEHD